MAERKPSRRGLKGRGPTPKAKDRTYHPAHKRHQQQQARQAARARREQRGPKFEAIGGRNTVVEALRARVPIEEIYLAQRIDADDRTREIVRIAANRDIPVHEVTKADLDGFAHGTSHQGVVARVHPYEYYGADDLLTTSTTPLILALDGITDPHNLGAALRSASAFGADGVVIPARRSASVGATAWKVSAGAAARVRVAQVTNLVRTLQEYKKKGLFVVGLDAGSSDTIETFGLAGEPLVLVLGSEDKGLSRLVRETCDMIVSIPIHSEMESLNASVALGVTLYEVSRTRGRVES